MANINNETIQRYEYWFRFLCLSDNYKRLCASFSEVNNKYPLPDTFSDWVLFKESHYEYIEWLSEHQKKLNLDTIFEGSNWSPQENMVHTLYPLFQNIHKDGFGGVKRRLELFFGQKDGGLPNPVLDGLIELQRLFVQVHGELYLRHKREPTASELIDRTTKWIEDNHDKWHFIKLDYFGYGLESVKQHFGDYLKKIYSPPKDIDARDKITHVWRIYLPEGTFGENTPSNFEDYITAYKLRNEGVPVSEILPELFPYIDFSPNSQTDIKHFKDTVHEYIRTAKQLIRNSENIQFPGSYGKKAKKKKAGYRGKTSQNINFTYTID